MGQRESSEHREEALGEPSAFDYTEKQLDAIFAPIELRPGVDLQEVRQKLQEYARRALSHLARGESRPSDAARKEIKRAARQLREALACLDSMSDEARGLMERDYPWLPSPADERRLAPWPEPIQAMPRAIDAMRDLRDAAEAAEGALPGPGRPRNDATVMFVRGLAWLYEEVTGVQRFGRRVDFFQEGSPESGPFFEFVSQALAPTGLPGNPAWAIRMALSRESDGEEEGEPAMEEIPSR